LWRYASGQSFNNLLLAAILGAITWGIWWTISQGVPSHLRQIQDGYEKVAAEHAREVDAVTSRSDALLRELIARQRLGQPHGVAVTPN
jgi:hypothetical protein